MRKIYYAEFILYNNETEWERIPGDVAGGRHRMWEYAQTIIGNYEGNRWTYIRNKSNNLRENISEQEMLCIMLKAKDFTGD